MITIAADHPNLVYSGRIDFRDKKAPVFVYAASFVRFRFTGNKVSFRISNQHGYYTNICGYQLDGKLGKFTLSPDSEIREYSISCETDREIHEITLYKRQDGCHFFTLHAILIEDGQIILSGTPLPKRRIEVFGDSVSCGEVCEALDHIGKPDPENHDGLYSDSWYAYGFITARELDAEVHLTAQGGAALFDETGWFHGPDYVGLDTIYDKLQYNTQIAPYTGWNFTNWTPQIVVFAFGQNDSNPEDYMAKSPDGEKAKHWIAGYQEFLLRMMRLYPKAHFILGTTTLMHHENWDKAIEEVCRHVGSERVTHLYYRDNGAGTPGHLRIPEQQKMAEDLIHHIKSLGDDIWNE